MVTRATRECSRMLHRPGPCSFRLTRPANCIVKTFSMSSHLFWRPGGATEGPPSPRPSKLSVRESLGLRCQPSVLRPRGARRPLQEEEAASVGGAPRVRRGWHLRAAARPHRRPDGESGLEEPSARSLRQLYMEIYTRGPFFAENATEHIGPPRGRPVKGFAALRIVAHCFQFVPMPAVRRRG